MTDISPASMMISNRLILVPWDTAKNLTGVGVFMSGMGWRVVG